VKLFTGLGALVLLVSAIWYLHRPIHYPPGVLIESEPVQMGLPANAATIHYGDFQLKPLAWFSLDARVLHRRNYRYDAQAPLVPTDLALGWGPMSDQQVIDKLNISQSMRFYWFEYTSPPPIPAEQIVSHSSNMHIIPATPAIASQCNSLRAGSLVHLRGNLVEATGPGIGHWRSSLSRTDTGNGACELFYVEEIEQIPMDPATKERALATK
jgi:hypothetical protein